MTGAEPNADERPFEVFFAEEFASVALIAGVTAGDRAYGEDIAQEAFAKASAQWAHVRSLDKPGSWVRRVAINLALTGRRRRVNETRVLRLVGEPEPIELEIRAGDPEVWVAVDHLAPRQRAVVVLHYFEDRSVAEIADVLEITVSATTSHLHQARRALAETLSSETLKTESPKTQSPKTQSPKTEPRKDAS